MTVLRKLTPDILYEVSKYLPFPAQDKLVAVNRESHELLSLHLLRRALHSPFPETALLPLRHAVKTGNLTLLSSIDYVIRIEGVTGRDWDWFLTFRGPCRRCEPRSSSQCWCESCIAKKKKSESCHCREFVLLKALRYSSECFRFLLDVILQGATQVLLLKSDPNGTYNWGDPPKAEIKYKIRPAELLATAIWHDHVDSVGIILDRPKLFEITNDHFDWESFMEPCNLLLHIPSVKMAEYVMSRGWKPPHEVLYEICSDSNLYKENRADLLKLMVSNGSDVHGADVEDTDGITPLHTACIYVNQPAIEALLKLGADPNAAPPSTYWKPIGDPDRHLGRPIDMLLRSYNWKDDWSYPNWRKVAQTMYKSIKAMIEQGAEISLPPGTQGCRNPVEIFLENIWALLCPPLKRVSIQDEENNLRWDRLPVLKKIPLASKEDDVTVERLLELLLAVDIRPLDKLCDIVLDSTAEYSEFAKGLRGKERLHAILPHVKTIHARHELDEREWNESRNPCLYTIKWNDGNDKFEGFDESYNDKHLDYYNSHFKENGFLCYHYRNRKRYFHHDVNATIRGQFQEAGFEYRRRFSNLTN